MKEDNAEKHLRGLKIRLALIFAAAALVILSAGFFYYRHYRTSLTTDAGALINSIRRFKENEIITWREDRLNDTQSLLDSPILSIYLNRLAADTSDPGMKAALKSRLQTYLKHNPYSAAYLTDISGKVITSDGSRPAICEDAKRLIQQAAVSARPVFGDFSITPGENQPHLDLVSKAAGGKSGKRLFLVLRIEPEDYFFPLMKNWPTNSRTGETLLVRKDGSDILFLNRLRDQQGAPMTLRLPLENSLLPAAYALKGKTGILQGTDYRGKKVLAAVGLVPGTDWGLVAKLDMDEIMADSAQVSGLLLLLTVLMLGAAGGGAFLFFRQQSEEYQKALETSNAQLAHSEDKFRLFFENSPLGKSITGLDGSLNVNRAFCAMLGYSEEELRHKKWRQITPAEDIEKTEAIVSSLTAGERLAAQFEKRYIRKDGGILYAEVTTALQRDAAGRPEYLITTVNDITARKAAEEALRESETAVRNKLNAIMEPEGDLGTLELTDIFDIPSLQKMMDELYKLTGITSAILDIKGKVIVASGWQDICTRFHRVNPGTCRNCLESDTLLTKDVAPGTSKSYFCKNNLRDIATPLMVGGRHIGNFFLGQFLYEDDPRNLDTFREQARRYGFDEKEYLAAYGRIPVFSRGNVDILISFYRQVTDLVSSLSYGKIKLARALAQSRLAEGLLNEAQSLACLGSYVLNIPTGNWTSSPVLDKVFGISADYGHTVEGWTRLIHPEDRAMMADYFRVEVAGKGIPFNKEYRIIRQDDKTERWVHGLGRLETDTRGRPVKMQGTIQDITERKQAELKIGKLNRALIEKNQEMENFLYITTHDLRSPLVNIQGFSQNLERYTGELLEALGHAQLPEEAKEALKDLAGTRIPGALKFVLESSRKMDALITALLKVSRLGRVEMKPAAVDMNELLKTIQGSLAFQLKQAGGKINCGVLPPCEADPGAVSQLFTNLLDNAIKYRDKNRALAVNVTGEIKDGVARYTVADNGPGIPAADLGRIWDIFYQPGRPRANRGEGIGLPMVKRFAEKNGGGIRAESKEGRGTVFYVELPAAGS